MVSYGKLSTTGIPSNEFGSYKDGSTLKDHVSDESYLALGELLTALGYEPNALDGVKPWYGATFLTNLSMAYTDYDWDMGIDTYFMQEAVKRGLPIVELESLRLQLEMFAGFSPELQEKQLTDAISGFYAEKDNLNELTDMWRTGDLEHLTRITEEIAEDEEYYNALLKDRNHGMAQKIDDYLKGDGSKTYFVIVGALHMAGEDGLVVLLEQMGYTVTRI